MFLTGQTVAVKGKDDQCDVCVILAAGDDCYTIGYLDGGKISEKAVDSTCLYLIHKNDKNTPAGRSVYYGSLVSNHYGDTLDAPFEADIMKEIKNCRIDKWLLIC